MLNFIKRKKENASEKWLLFIIATAVAFFGIGYELLKGTSATDTISEVPANPAFDDINFYKCVVDAYNKKNSSDVGYTTNLSDDDLATITHLACGGSNKPKIKSVKGLEKLISLKYLYLYWNELESLDVSNNTKLTTLKVGYNQLTTLDVSKNTALTELDVYSNQLAELNVSNNTELTKLRVGYNQLTTLDVSENTALTELDVYSNQLAELDLSNNTILTILAADHNKLITLDVSNNTALTTLGISFNKLTELNVSNNTKLTELDAYSNQLKELDVSNNVALTRLSASENQLKSFNVSNNTALKYLLISENQLMSLDVSKNLDLVELSIAGNLIETLDIKANTKLVYLSAGGSCIPTFGSWSSYCGGNLLTELDASNNIALQNLYVENNQLVKLDVSNNTALQNLYVSDNQLTKLDVSNNTALQDLYVSGNQLTKLDVSNNTVLQDLDVSENQLTELDMSNNTVLQDLDVSENQLTELDMSNNIKLTGLDVYSNQLKELDVSNNTVLIILDASNNQLAELDMSNNTVLKTLRVGYNQLTKLDVSNNTALQDLYVSNNQLTKLDVGNNTALQVLYVGNNQLTELDMSNNTTLKNLWLAGNPYSETLYVYKGKTITVGNNVKIASHLNWSKPVWISGDTEIATVDTSGLVTTLKSGSVDVEGAVTSKYTTTSTVNVVEITSDKYEINEEEGYILVGSDNDIDTISSNIKVSHEDVDLNVDINNYKLQVKYGDEVLKEFDIIGYSSSEYDLSKDYIYVGLGELDLNKINTVNCNASIDSNKLVIKKDNVIVGEYLLVSISSSKYDLSKDYIYIGADDFISDDITVVNSTSLVDEDKLLIKYDEDILDEFDLISITSDVYDLSKDYIYVGTNDINISNIVTKCNLVVEDNKLLINYKDELLDQYILVSIEINNYNVVGKYITNIEEISYEDFISNIVVDDGVTYKLFNGDEEVSSGNISVGMILKIYYNESEVYEYSLVNDYFDMGVDYNIDEQNSVISNVLSGTTNEGLLENVETNGEVSILDKDDNVVDSTGSLKTGDKFIVTFPNYSLTYKISVLGDVNGDGIMNRDDIELSSKHIIKGNLIIGAEYLKALDVDNNDKADINDIIKMVKRLKDGGDTDE